MMLLNDWSLEREVSPLPPESGRQGIDMIVDLFDDQLTGRGLATHNVDAGGNVLGGYALSGKSEHFSVFEVIVGHYFLHTCDGAGGVEGHGAVRTAAYWCEAYGFIHVDILTAEFVIEFEGNLVALFSMDSDVHFAIDDSACSAAFAVNVGPHAVAFAIKVFIAFGDDGHIVCKTGFIIREGAIGGSALRCL